jgi:hypothetical protein
MRRMLLAALATCATLAAGAALAQEGPPPGMRMPAPEDIFKRWDANSDGVVDKAEWTAAGRPEDRFAMIDANKDGKVTLDELKTAFETMRQRRMQQGDGPPPGPPPEGPPPQGN